MHSVALEKAFQILCLNFNFVTDQISPKLTKPKAIALRFFSENGPFWQLPLKAYNLSLE